MKKQTPVTELKNIAATSAGWLQAIGVHTRADLEKLGPLATYRILKEQGYNASVNLVYALQGALMDRHWQKLPTKLKVDLRSAAKAACRPRCGWAGNDPLYQRYHDEEWGVPVHDDRRLFEFLILEGAQAGLSWITILRKRVHYRKAFAGFDPRKVARFDQKKINTLMQNPGIVRNRLKIQSAVLNAQQFLAVQKEFGSFDRYVWSFVDAKPLRNHWRSMKELPARTAQSDALSKDLKKRGFKFVGSTICYAFMQAVGMVNDHTLNCFRYKRLVK